MIRLKKLLTEYESVEPFTPKQIDEIYKEIQNKKQSETLILRGAKLGNFDYRTSQIRDDRKLRDTRKEINSILTVFNKEYGYKIPDRRQCIFATNSNLQASGYGDVITTIFPSKKAIVMYNPKYSDSFS